MDGAVRSRVAGTIVALAFVLATALGAAEDTDAAAPGAAARAALLVTDADGAWAMLPDGSARAAVPWLRPGDTGLAVSPSGRRLAFSSARDGNRELYVVDLDTGVLARVTVSPGREDVEPAWSPDGTQLVWASGREGAHDLYRARADGSRPRRFTSGPADDREPAWSPDGRRIAFASNELGAFDLWQLGPGGGERTLLVDGAGDARAPDWHPSGARLAYTGVVGGAADVWVAGPAGVGRRLVASPGYDGRPDWSPDGTQVAFLRGTGGTLRPWRARFDGSRPVPVAPLPRGALQLVWERLGATIAPARSALLPDLDQRAPSDLVVRARGGGGYVLGFTSATDNRGLGPVWLRGRRSTTREPMLVEQLVERANGPVTTLGGVGELRYELHPPHRHWHLADFVRYELRTPDGRVAVRDRKSGFCLTDRWARPRALRGRPSAPPRFVGDCSTLQPGSLAVEEGTSAGYTDVYPAFFHGQDLDLTGLAAGRYLLVQVANPERRLRERDYGNNAASALLRLSWPAGRAAPPRVDVVRRCGAGPSCGVSAPTIPE